jgi:hypothetical protein
VEEQVVDDHEKNGNKLLSHRLLMPYMGIPG